jgi:hypothetical protein
LPRAPPPHRPNARLGQVEKNTLATPPRRDSIENDFCRHHIAIDRGGDIVLHEPFGENCRLMPRALWLPGRIAGLAFLKPVFQICDCIFSHGHASLSKCGKYRINGALILGLLKRHGIIERC